MSTTGSLTSLIRARTGTIVEVLGCLLWTACPAPVEESALADCEAQYAELRERVARDCACEEEGHGFGLCGSSPEQEPASCACAIEAADPDNEAVLACRARREAEYTDCFTPLACDDQVGKVACRAIYVAGVQACGELSKPSHGQVLLECHDRPAFECGSGEIISKEYVCDLEADCVDMSDEAECYERRPQGVSVRRLSTAWTGARSPAIRWAIAE